MFDIQMKNKRYSSVVLKAGQKEDMDAMSTHLDISGPYKKNKSGFTWKKAALK